MAWLSHSLIRSLAVKENLAEKIFNIPLGKAAFHCGSMWMWPLWAVVLCSPFLLREKDRTWNDRPTVTGTSGVPQSHNFDIIICKYFISVLRKGKFHFSFNQADRLFCRLQQAARRPEDRCCLDRRKNYLVFWTRQEWSTMPLEAMSSISLDVFALAWWPQGI